MVKKYCPDCKSPLEVLQACGCQDLFCQNCGKMVSKKQALVLDDEQDKCMPESSSATSTQDSAATEHN